MRDDGLTEEAGEGYFASVSDLMVGVLFIFLLMLTVFALNFRDDSAKLDDLIVKLEQAERHARQAHNEAIRLRAQNEALRQRLQEAAEALKRELAGREAARELLLRRLAQGLEQRGIRFLLDARSGVLRLSDAIPFAVGRSDITDAARGTLAALAEVLAQTLPCFARGVTSPVCAGGDGAILEALLVEGHTDSQPYQGLTATQSRDQNDLLSTSRALAVFAELRRQQPVLEALRNPSDQPLLGVSGYGQRRPLPDTVEAANRRIDLRFVLSARTSDELQRLLDGITVLQQEQTP